MFSHRGIFSPKKFLSLSLIQRHKKAASLLRSIYCALPSKTPSPEHQPKEEIQAYTAMEAWLKISPPLFPPLTSSAPLTQWHEKMAERYHLHCSLAQISHKEHNLLPHPSHLEDEAKNSPPEEDLLVPFLPLAIYLDHLRSSHNIGSIIRTTEALRLGQLYLPPDAYLSKQKIEKTAMGTSPLVEMSRSSIDLLPRPWIALEKCPQKERSQEQRLDTQKRQEEKQERLFLHDKVHSLCSYSFPGTFTLILGNEEVGISQELLGRADAIVEIPLWGRKNSLNVACAFSMAAYEIVKQLRS